MCALSVHGLGRPRKSGFYRQRLHVPAFNAVFDSLRGGKAIAETHRVVEKTRVSPIKIREAARGASHLRIVAAL